MKYTRFIGIDPGNHGALALLDQNGVPVLVNNLTMPEVSEWLPVSPHGNNDHVVAAVELPVPVPKESTRSAQRLGIWIGSCWAFLSAAGVRFRTPSPQEWKRGVFFDAPSRIRKMPLDKTASRAYAEYLYDPSLLGMRGDEGRSEALLIARWVWLKERKQ